MISRDFGEIVRFCKFYDKLMVMFAGTWQRLKSLLGLMAVELLFDMWWNGKKKEKGRERNRKEMESERETDSVTVRWRRDNI